MLNVYEEPNMKIIQFEDSYDIITTSGETDTEDEDTFGPW